MVTIKEIAKYCGVSIATVSNIINGKPNASEATKQKELKAIDELNYTPNYVAKNLRTQKSKTIGVIVEDITVFCAPEIIDGITQCSEERGYNILFTNLRLYQKLGDTYYDDENLPDLIQSQTKDFKSKQVDGIVYVATHERTLKCFKGRLDVPAAMAYGMTDSKEHSSVIVDDLYGAHKLIDYVIAMGHRRIGVITGKYSSIHTNDRLEGYKKALAEHGIEFDPRFVVKGDWTRKSGYDNTDSLLDLGVTAIFCMNDIMAGGVYDRLEAEGLVPGDDISVVGFDNRELATFCEPALTTISLPLFDIGYEACRRVIEDIEKEDDLPLCAQIIPVKGKMYIRDSVKDIN